MRSAIAALLAVLVLISFCACTPKTHSDDGASTPAPAPTPTPTEEQQTEAAVVRLNCFDRIGHLEALLPVDSAKAVVRYGALTDEPDPADRMYAEYFALIDTNEDALLAECQMHFGSGEVLLGVRDNGEIVSAYPPSAQLGFYGADLTFEREVQLPEELAGGVPIFDCEGERLIFLAWNRIYEVTLDGSMSTAAEFDGDVSPRACDPAVGIAFCETPDDASLYGRSLTVYDIVNKTVLFSAPTTANEYFMHDGRLAVSSVRPMSTEDGGPIENRTIFTLFGADHAPEKAFVLGNEYSLAWQNGAEYAFAIEFKPIPGSIDSSAVPVLLDFDKGSAAEVQLDIDGAYDLDYCFLDDVRCLIASCGSTSDNCPDGMGTIALHAADTSLMEFDRRLVPAAPDTEDYNRAQLESNRIALREMADEIEADFGVTVVFGDDCLKADQPDGHTVVSTDALQRDASAEVYDMLRELRKNLELYPEGFFEYFKDEDGAGGMRFLAVSELSKDEHESFGTAGVFYKYYNRYNIMIDVNEIGTAQSTIPHEIWHSVEARIWDEYPASFDYMEWNALNPEGFEDYLYDFDEYQQKSEYWEQYILDTGSEPYFARSYSLVNAKEDRATLIELLFNLTFGEDAASSAAALSMHPHLKAKLDYMAEQVIKVFGETYWQ